MQTSIANSSEYYRGLLYAIVSVVLVSIAQLTMKFGVAHVALDDIRALDSLRTLLENFTTLIPTAAWLPIAVGIGCYAASVLSWMAALGRLPLNLAYPLLSLSYPLVYLGAALLPFFHEPLNVQRVAGVGLIMFGITLLMLRGNCCAKNVA